MKNPNYKSYDNNSVIVPIQDVVKCQQQQRVIDVLTKELNASVERYREVMQTKINELDEKPTIQTYLYGV